MIGHASIQYKKRSQFRELLTNVLLFDHEMTSSDLQQ